MDYHLLCSQVLSICEYAIIAYVACINSIYLLLMVLGYFALRSYPGELTCAERDVLAASPLLPGIAVIAPAYNEAATVRESVRALLSLRYPNVEVIVVNDGSKDQTLQILIDEFKLHKSPRDPSGPLPCSTIRSVYASHNRRLTVIDKHNGGKADALNAGLNVARSPLAAVVDSDSLLEEDALLLAAKPFLEDPGHVVASGGIVRVANGCSVEHGRVVHIAAPKALLPLMQSVEYLRAFLGGRVAFSALNSLLVISGAFGLFRRDTLLAVGGFDTSTVGEDLEVVVRIHKIMCRQRRAYRIVFVPEPVCWTEVPGSLRLLGRQRNRWQRGTVQTLAAHREMAFNYRFGVLGLFAIPYFAAFEMIGPAIELFGYALTAVALLFGMISWQLATLFFTVAVLFGVLLSLSTLVLEQFTTRRYQTPFDVVVLFCGALLENLGYRQLLAVWRTKGIIDALQGKKGWGVMERSGFRTRAEA